jgi:hypothetical protein
MPNLTENAKVLIFSKLEEAWSIRRVAQYCNIAKSTVSNLPNLYKKHDVQISRRHLYMWKKL